MNSKTIDKIIKLFITRVCYGKIKIKRISVAFVFIVYKQAATYLEYVHIAAVLGIKTTSLKQIFCVMFGRVQIVYRRIHSLL